MLNKPRGYVTTLSDERGRPTAAELVADCGTRVYPVGRLDLDSEGLLIFTNDGAWMQRILHPSHEIEKTYEVTVAGAVENAAAELAAVRSVDGEPIAPARVASAAKGEGNSGAVRHHPRGEKPPDPADVCSGRAARQAPAPRAGAHPIARRTAGGRLARADCGRGPRI